MSVVEQAVVVSATFAFFIGIIISSIVLYHAANVKSNLFNNKNYILTIFAFVLVTYISFTLVVWESIIIILANTTGLLIFLYFYVLKFPITDKKKNGKLNDKGFFLKLINYPKNMGWIITKISSQKIIYALVSIFVFLAILGFVEKQDNEDVIFPTYEYAHEGRTSSVTGGFVYRGDSLTSLYGKYIYGDYARSEIRILDIKDNDAKGSVLMSSSEKNTFVTGGLETLRPVAFGAFNGDIYIADHTGHLLVMNEAENGSLYLEKIFPNYLFNNPVGITQSNIEENVLLIIEKEGRILKANLETKNITLLYDMTERVATEFYEQGLLGIALNPHLEDDSEIFITYNSIIEGDVYLSKLTQENGTYDEKKILIVYQETKMHNGGHIVFGPDGYLYMGTGDDTNSKTASELDSLNGKILRIDIQNKTLGKEYSIPQNNPYYKNDQGWKEEIYAHGFRNPWKFSFDEKTEQLWLGDVGLKSREEINIVVSGGNYGWPDYEGTQCNLIFSNCINSTLVIFSTSITVSISFLSFYFSSINLIPLKNTDKKKVLILFFIGLSTAFIWYYKTYLTLISDWRDVDMILNVSTIIGFYSGIITIIGLNMDNIEKPKNT